MALTLTDLRYLLRLVHLDFSETVDLSLSKRVERKLAEMIGKAVNTKKQ